MGIEFPQKLSLHMVLTFNLLIRCITLNDLHILENPRDGGAWWAAVYGVTELDTTEVT